MFTLVPKFQSNLSKLRSPTRDYLDNNQLGSSQEISPQLP